MSYAPFYLSEPPRPRSGDRWELNVWFESETHLRCPTCYTLNEFTRQFVSICDFCKNVIYYETRGRVKGKKTVFVRANEGIEIDDYVQVYFSPPCHAAQEELDAPKKPEPLDDLSAQLAVRRNDKERERDKWDAISKGGFV